MTRITKAEMTRRVDTVMDLLAKGLKRADIVRYASEKTDWKVEERQIENYIKQANKAFTELSAVDRAREVGKANERFSMLFQAAFKVQDYGRAIAAERARCDLLGLNAPKELRILEGVNERQLADLVTALSKRGIPASEIFNALIQQLAEVEADAGE